MLTYDDITVLSGDALNEAVARADGWEYSETHGWHKKKNLSKKTPINIRKRLPDYRSGDLVDGLAREVMFGEISIGEQTEIFMGDRTEIFMGDTEISFKSPSLTTAILRAWLWWAQNQKGKE
jgi:hypothetical protein